MASIIGDRRENTLDEMEEVSRQFNKEVAEEERLERIEEERIRRKEETARKAENPKAPTKPLVTPDSGIGNITADDALIFEGNWAQCVSGCRAKSLEVAAARQIAELRIKHGKDSVYCRNGGWAAEDFNYLPSGDILVASADYNPLLRHAVKATNKHDAGKEFYLDDRIVAMLLKAEKNGGVLLLKIKDVPKELSVDAFGKEPLTAFLGWNQDYADFLNKCEIKNIKLFVADKQKQAFSRGLWVGSLGDSSAILGDSSLSSYGRVFGVRRGAKNPAGTRGSQ